MLPLVWATEGDEVVKNWFRCLSTKTKRSYKRLERAFVRKWGEDEVRARNVELTSSSQPSHRSCEDWFLRQCRQHELLRELSPKHASSEQVLLDSMIDRFTNDSMILFFPCKRGGSGSDTSLSDNPLNERQILRWCRQADKQTKRRNRVRATPKAHVKEYDLDDDIVIRSISGPDPEDQLREYFAEEYLVERGADLTSIMVARVQEKREPPAPVQFRPLQDMKVFLNVMHRNHPDSSGQICPFESTKASGCKQRSCKFAHTARRNEPCTKGSLNHEDCPHGAWCPKRHKGDLYVIWFFDRRKNGFKQYVWKDLRSEFSSHRL